MKKTAPAPENINIDDEEIKCLIHSRTEIAFLLRSIMKHNALITAYFNKGNEFILTSIVGFDASGDVLLDLGPDEDLNQRLVESRGQILFTTTHERVKVKFASAQATKVSFKGREAFRIAIPQKLVRMQRREYYRVATGIVNPLKCRITLPIEGADTLAEVTVLDLSCGGVALIDQHHTVDLEPGNEYRNCNITLPDLGTIVTGLQVCNTFEVTLRNGLACKRSGCQYIGLQESERGLIQRYITRLERDLSAKGGR
jgi:c-di-GMP-binding flagellar brake protein YcgR